MSLATRCTACGTIFRVVQDQLRVSEGWVRCGRCAEVFDARDQLFDIDREAPPPWPAEAPVQAGAPSSYHTEAAMAPEPQTWHQASDVTDVFVDAEPSPPAPTSWAEESPPRQDVPAPYPSPAAIEPRETHFDVRPDEPRESSFGVPPSSRVEPQWVDEEEPAATQEVAGLTKADEAAAEAEAQRTAVVTTPVAEPQMDTGPDVVLAPRLVAAEGTDTPAVEPSFMRSGNKAQRWNRPGVRMALIGTTVLLFVLLGLQITRHFHDAIATLYPSARTGLQAFCQFSACELKPWRRIDVVSVENSALNQAGTGNQYQLAVSLHNKSGLEVATPWIELNLIDASGAVVTRRMLAPSDFRTGKPTLLPGADLALQALLTTGPQRVSGYSVEIFHP